MKTYTVEEIGWNPVRIVKNRLDRGLNWMSIISGEPGSGKSYSAMKLGEMIDKDFNIDKVALDSERFLDLINETPPKSVLICDEAGVQFSSREWMTARNKALGAISQTFRFKQLGVIWTLPDISMIDVQIRRLFHSFLETVGVDRNRQETLLKWFTIRFDKWMGRIYHLYPRAQGGSYIIKTVRLNKPSEDLIKEYEKKKRRAFDDLFKEAKESLSKAKSKEEKGGKSVNDMKEEVLNNLDYFADAKGRIIPLMLKERFGLKGADATDLKRVVEREIG